MQGMFIKIIPCRKMKEKSTFIDRFVVLKMNMIVCLRCVSIIYYVCPALGFNKCNMSWCSIFLRLVFKASCLLLLAMATTDCIRNIPQNHPWQICIFILPLSACMSTTCVTSSSVLSGSAYFTIFSEELVALQNTLRVSSSCKTMAAVVDVIV